MPAHLAVYDGDGEPADDIAIAISGGEESAIFVRQIWNDKDGSFGDTSTAVGAMLALLANVGSGYKRSGVAVLDQRWFRARVTGALGTAHPYVTGTQPLGVNAELPLGDIPPGGGVEIEMQAFAPSGNATAAAIKFDVDGNLLSAPLAKYTTLAHGSGIVPADRIPGLLSLLSGGDVTANDTDTVSIARGKMVAGGIIVAYPATTAVMTLADGAAVDLAAGEDYHVTLSRDPGGALVVTKGLKAEEVEFPDVPEGNILVAHLNVTSADGVAVAVAQSSVVMAENRYAAFDVRAGAGLAVIIARGDGVTGGDLRQYVSHEIAAPVVASETNRVWRLGDGNHAITQSDEAPEFDADLVALAITDVGSITSIVDMRRFAHRAVTTWPLDLIYRGVLTDLAEPSHGLAMVIAHFDCEIEEIEENVSALDPGLTGGEIKIDVLALEPGEPAPFPAGGAGGTTIFTSSATDDARPSIAHDATNLRAVTSDHEVRRFPAGTRFLLSAITTVTGPGGEPEQELRVTLHARRYR